MGLSALHRKCCASNRSTFPPPIASPGPCWCVIFLSHQQIPSHVFSNKEFNFSHLKKKKISFHRFPTCTRRPTCHALPQLRARAHNAGLLRTPNPSDPGPSGYWRYHNSFFPNGKPGKMIEPVCVAKRLASTGSEGKKIELCVFFFLLPLAKDLGAFDVQSAGIKKKKKERKEKKKKHTHTLKRLGCTGALTLSSNAWPSAKFIC